jgi:hypothetical protein
LRRKTLPLTRERKILCALSNLWSCKEARKIEEKLKGKYPNGFYSSKQQPTSGNQKDTYWEQQQQLQRCQLMLLLLLMWKFFDLLVVYLDSFSKNIQIWKRII